ncbi:MAG: TatD family hydrolase, partial [Duncaniella sp.]|nr:TatD family hydrolase [Duncaniella sp.]
MTLIDTHTHLYLPEFDADRDEVMTRALDSGITTMIFPNVDLTTVSPMKELHGRYPHCTLMAMGLHPTEVTTDWRETLARIETEFHSGGYIAVGEIGIDLYWDKTYEKEQMDVFHRQVATAVEADLPVIIHCREGLDQALEVLQDFRGKARGVFHSFGGSTTDVELIRREGDYHFGINGIVTFKNSRLREVLPAIGAGRIVLDTDAPYLAPVPLRGKRNETAYIVNTAEAVASA